MGEEDILLDKRKVLKNKTQILTHLSAAYKLISAESIEEAFLGANKALIAFDTLLPEKVDESIENIDGVEKNMK